MTGITVKDITQRFNRRTVLKDVNFTAEQGKVFGITGKNGSGKSTLVKIISGIISPTKGSIAFTRNGEDIPSEKRHEHIGLVGPYLTLYEEFSALENLRFFHSIRGLKYDEQQSNELLARLDLPTDRSDPIAAYSSGMMQRMRFAFALLHDPAFLFLDEPTSNLDTDGKNKVHGIVRELSAERCIIIATNDYEDFVLCDDYYSVDGSVPALLEQPAN
ncbi:MAG: ABC transporter ATP-binding protein [Ectothiorhodospiraceae bacterium]|nr:ABC transporter ATP-binding protein [Ectothiorhodospiraceae bacterium]